MLRLKIIFIAICLLLLTPFVYGHSDESESPDFPEWMSKLSTIVANIDTLDGRAGPLPKGIEDKLRQLEALLPQELEAKVNGWKFRYIPSWANWDRKPLDVSSVATAEKILMSLNVGSMGVMNETVDMNSIGSRFSRFTYWSQAYLLAKRLIDFENRVTKFVRNYEKKLGHGLNGEKVMTDEERARHLKSIMPEVNVVYCQHCKTSPTRQSSLKVIDIVKSLKEQIDLRNLSEIVTVTMGGCQGHCGSRFVTVNVVFNDGRRDRLQVFTYNAKEIDQPVQDLMYVVNKFLSEGRIDKNQKIPMVDISDSSEPIMCEDLLRGEL